MISRVPSSPGNSFGMGCSFQNIHRSEACPQARRAAPSRASLPLGALNFKWQFVDSNHGAHDFEDRRPA